MYTGSGLVRRNVGLVCAIFAICNWIFLHVSQFFLITKLPIYGADIAHSCTYAMIMVKGDLMSSFTS